MLQAPWQTTYTPSMSRSLHFEAGLLSMSCHCKREHEWDRHFPVYCMHLHYLDESWVPRCESTRSHPSHPSPLPPATKPTLHPNPATCSPGNQFAGYRGQSLLLLSMLGLPRVVVLEGEVETAERDKQRGELRWITSSGGQRPAVGRGMEKQAAARPEARGYQLISPGRLFLTL